jgi:hypothetical protein
MPWPQTVSDAAMRVRFPGGIGSKVTYVLVGSVEGGAVYTRDGSDWRLLPGEPVACPPPWRNDEPA